MSLICIYALYYRLPAYSIYIAIYACVYVSLILRMRSNFDAVEIYSCKFPDSHWCHHIEPSVYIIPNAKFQRSWLEPDVMAWVINRMIVERKEKNSQLLSHYNTITIFLNECALCCPSVYYCSQKIGVEMIKQGHIHSVLS